MLAIVVVNVTVLEKPQLLTGCFWPVLNLLPYPGLWLVRSRPPPKIHEPPNIEYATADLQVQPHSDIIYGDPEYTWDDYIQS